MTKRILVGLMIGMGFWSLVAFSMLWDQLNSVNRVNAAILARLEAIPTPAENSWGSLHARCTKKESGKAAV